MATRMITSAELFRRAEQARTEGVVLFQRKDKPTEFMAKNATKGTVYMVNEQGCTCDGHKYGGICKHRSLLLVRIAERQMEATINGAA